MSLFGQSTQSNQVSQSLLDQLREQQEAFAKTMGQPVGGYSGLLQWQIGAAQALQQQKQATPVKLPEEVVIHALVGWRRWSVSMFGETLKSNNGFGWDPYKRIEASCLSPTCAGINCGCGIYAYKERSQAEKGENAPSQVTHVWGEVWLWGRIIEHATGFRAQFAYPKAFVNTGGISQRLAYVYGVKLIDGGAAA